MQILEKGHPFSNSKSCICEPKLHQWCKVVSVKAMDNGVKKSVIVISKTWSLLWQSGVLMARPSWDLLPPSPVPWQDNSLHSEQIVSRRPKNASIGSQGPEKANIYTQGTSRSIKDFKKIRRAWKSQSAAHEVEKQIHFGTMNASIHCHTNNASHPLASRVREY